MHWKFFFERWDAWCFGPDWFPDGSAVWLNMGPLRLGFERIDGASGVLEDFAFA